jgi:hypothetical protein
MNRINYIVFLLIFIFQQSTANSLNNSENITEPNLVSETIAKKQKITTPNIRRIQAFLQEVKIRCKLVLPLLIAGIIELYLNTDLDTKIATRLEKCEQEFDRNKFITCKNSYYDLIRHKRIEINAILQILPIYLMIDIVLSSSFIISKNLHYYIASPVSFFIDVLFNWALYIYLFYYYSFIFESDSLSTFMMTFAIITCFVNIYYRTKEKNKIDRKLAQLTN